jgi:hypothetical protein
VTKGTAAGTVGVVDDGDGEDEGVADGVGIGASVDGDGADADDGGPDGVDPAPGSVAPGPQAASVSTAMSPAESSMVFFIESPVVPALVAQLCGTIP